MKRVFGLSSESLAIIFTTVGPLSVVKSNLVAFIFPGIESLGAFVKYACTDDPEVVINLFILQFALKVKTVVRKIYLGSPVIVIISE